MLKYLIKHEDPSAMDIPSLVQHETSRRFIIAKIVTTTIINDDDDHDNDGDEDDDRDNQSRLALTTAWPLLDSAFADFLILHN